MVWQLSFFSKLALEIKFICPLVRPSSVLAHKVYYQRKRKVRNFKERSGIIFHLARLIAKKLFNFLVHCWILWCIFAATLYPIFSTPACLLSDIKKQIVLDGPRSCGKSIALAMLVHWASTEGWLVFYVPQGKDWTHGGFFYRNTYSDLFDTPIQAAKILQVLSSVWFVCSGYLK